jgi:hypothetical protein
MQSATASAATLVVQVATIRGYAILKMNGVLHVAKRTALGEYRSPIGIVMSDGVLALVADAPVHGAAAEIEVADRTRSAIAEWAREFAAA